MLCRTEFGPYSYLLERYVNPNPNPNHHPMTRGLSRPYLLERYANLTLTLNPNPKP